MKTVFRASALAAMLMSGAALSAWAAAPADSQGNTAPSINSGSAEGAAGGGAGAGAH